MKRLFDLFVSLLVLLCFLPFGLMIAVILKLTGEGEIFYLQKRVGKNQKVFHMIKFATMLKASPALGSGDITLKNDPRVLPMGRFLRKTKLNEFPQFINVLIGDMSLVGPRPLTQKNYDYYSDNEKNIIASMRPGITGIGSLYFRDEESLLAGKTIDENIRYYKENIAPLKAQLEKWYKVHCTVFLDIKIMWMTAIAVVNPTSRYSARFFNTIIDHTPQYKEQRERRMIR